MALTNVFKGISIHRAERRPRGRANFLILAGVMGAAFGNLCQAGPIITSAGPVSTQQFQTIDIAGSGFGTSSPYSGDSLYIELFDVTRGWAAGYVGPCYDGSNYYGGFCDDSVTLVIGSWSDSSVVLGGFAGSWGAYTLGTGDEIEIAIWNAQTGTGPATTTAVVGSTSGAPEPSSFGLIVIGFAVLGTLVFRKRRSVVSSEIRHVVGQD